MGVVYYDRAWLRLKAELQKKPSHSARELAETMARLEVECAVPEDVEQFDSSPVPRRGTSREDMRRDTVRSSARPAQATA